MTELPRGQAVIINVNYYHPKFKAKPRDECEKDAEEMKFALIKLGFEVDMNENSKEIKTLSWMKDKFEKVAKYKENEKFSVIVLMTYVTEEGKFLAFDKAFKIEELWKPFVKDTKSPLSNRVRIIIVQGHLLKTSGTRKSPDEQDDNIEEDDDTYSIILDSIKRNGTIPVESNILIVYSIAEEYNLEKHKNYRSSFMESLSNILKDKQFWKEDILKLMTYLCHLVNQRNHDANQSKELKQLTSISTSLIQSFSLYREYKELNV